MDDIPEAENDRKDCFTDTNSEYIVSDLCPWESSLLLPYQYCLGNAAVVNHYMVNTTDRQTIPKKHGGRCVITRIVDNMNVINDINFAKYRDHNTETTGDLLKNVSGWKISRDLYCQVLDVEFLGMIVKINPMCFDKFKIYLDDNDIDQIFHIDVILSNVHSPNFLKAKISNYNGDKNVMIKTIKHSVSDSEQTNSQEPVKVDSVNCSFSDMSPENFNQKISQNLFFSISTQHHDKEKPIVIPNDSNFVQYLTYFEKETFEMLTKFGLNGIWEPYSSYLDSSTYHRFIFEKSTVITSYFLHNLKKFFALKHYSVSKITIGRSVQKPYCFSLNMRMGNNKVGSDFINIPTTLIYEVSDFHQFVMNSNNDDKKKHSTSDGQKRDTKEPNIHRDHGSTITEKNNKETEGGESEMHEKRKSRMSGTLNWIYDMLPTIRPSTKRKREEQGDDNGDQKHKKAKHENTPDASKKT